MEISPDLAKGAIQKVADYFNMSIDEAALGIIKIVNFNIIMKRILLVEDDPFLIDIYSTKLKETGFEVETVDNGQEVFKKIRETTPDLILLDIVLPNVDGWEILNEIRGDKEIKNIKVIILSNLSQKMEVEKGMNLGAVKYLIKAHYTPAEVVEEIKKALK